MSVPDFLAPAITSMYDTTAGSDYGGFVDWIQAETSQRVAAATGHKRGAVVGFGGRWA